ncbi:MAG TPA: hypothetical protein DCL35_04360 [Candidatus Omnitrophica bacterium]|nr:hypothetical protein [Candidatus Omnitrophota bacterium]
MQKKPFVVIEFNAATIRVCRSVVRRGRRAVTHCFSFPLSVSWQDLPQEIRANFKNRKLRASSAVLMLPRDKAVSHTWVLPSNNAEEISQMVRLRVLKEYSGLGKEDVVYDYKITGTDKEGCAQVVAFLLRKAQILRYTEVLSRSGIVVRGVTLNTAGLLNWLESLDSIKKKECGHRVFLLNADDRSFDLQLLAEGKTIFSRSFHVAEADERQDTLSKEVKLSLELCRRQQKAFSGGGPEADFCITGASEKLLGLDIDSWLGKEFKAFDPLEEARSYLDLKSPANGMSVSYAAALGLALTGSYEGLDLTPPDIKRENELLERKKAFKRWFLSLTILFFFICSVFCVSAEHKISRLFDLKAKLAASAGTERALDILLLEHYLDKEVLGDAFIMDVSRKLFENTPSGVTFSSLDINDSALVSIAGVAENIGALTLFFSRLKSESSFKDIKMDFNQAKEKQDGADIKFKISWQCRR